MAIDSKHPEYQANAADWVMLRDAYAGESAVKRKRDVYLPPTSSQQLDGMLNANQPGYKAYDAYLQRAEFPDYVREAVETYIGMMHKTPAKFVLPSALAGMELRATREGEGLQALLRRINEQQLAVGRLALLVDFTVGPDGQPMPYIALYAAENVINWDESADYKDVNKLNMLVLDESGYRRKPDFSWQHEKQYRVLQLVPAGEVEQFNKDPVKPVPTGAAGDYVYLTSVATGDQIKDPLALAYWAPMYRGAPCTQLPAVVINVKDCVAATDVPPLLGLGKKCMTIYRGQADYRQSLHMTGQDTLVTIGTVANATDAVDDPMQENVRVGAGARIAMEMGGDAKYIGVSAEGIGGQKDALEADAQQAQERAGKLATASASHQESGQALGTRLSAQTVSLKQIAQTGAMGLQMVLQALNVWMGGTAAEVEVQANLEFGTPIDTAGQELTQLMAAKNMGAPLSRESIHQVAVERGLTRMSYEDEMAAIEEETPMGLMLPAKLAPNDPNNPGNTPPPSNKSNKNNK